MSQKKLALLDRDGVLNVSNGYVGYKKYFKWTCGAKKSIKYLKSIGYKIFVVTNQSGIARGFFSYKDVLNLHNYMNKELRRYGTKIDKFYICPHHIDGVMKKYKKQCNCRKPNTGLFSKIEMNYTVDKKKSFMIGDQSSDIQFAKKIGIKAFLFRKKNLFKFILNLPINAKKN